MTQINQYHLAIVSAGVGEPSTTSMLAGRALSAVEKYANQADAELIAHTIDLRTHQRDLGNALTSQNISRELEETFELIHQADGLIVASPVFKAEPSALFNAYFQVMEQDLLIGKPTLLAATAGTARHSLVVDHSMRALFAYLRALVVPTSLFAAGQEWASTEFTKRVQRSAYELWLLMASGFQRKLQEETWGTYQHNFNSQNSGEDFGIDFDSDLIKLATGQR